MILRAYARNVSTLVKKKSLLDDVTSSGEVSCHVDTFDDYVAALEKQKAEAQRDNVIAQSCSIASERDRAIKELNSQIENVQLRINNAVKLANAEKDKTISRLQGELNSRKLVFAIIADMLYAASEVFKRAIDAIIHYSTDTYKSIFGSDEAADIKSVMQSYGKTKE